MYGIQPVVLQMTGGMTPVHRRPVYTPFRSDIRKDKRYMKILNLYAGIGGNRKLWGEEYSITAVESDSKIASIYQDFFPKDELVIGDAHQYLLDHYTEFDFIWSSPPCQTHASFRQNICVRYQGTKPVYPDMKLYQEILFLGYNFGGKWVVENVRPYYPPLIPPTKVLQRHLFWSNFTILDIKFHKKDDIRGSQIPQLQEIHDFDLSKYKLANKRQILRNCVAPEMGKHILSQVLWLDTLK